MIDGERIRKLRKNLNLTQEELGIAIDLTGRMIGFIETGDKDVSVETLIRLADFFNVSTDYLLGRSDLDSRHIEKQFADMLNRLKAAGLRFDYY